MEKRKQFFGLRYPPEELEPIFESDLGTHFESAGLVLRGKKGLIVIIGLPDTKISETPTYKIIDADKEDWIRILKHLDDPAYYVTDELGIVKAIVKKNQRQVGMGIQWEVFKRDGYKCRYCGKDGIPMTVDHIVPVEKGGTDEMVNLATACRRCNKEKADMSLKEYCEWKENRGKV